MKESREKSLPKCAVCDEEPKTLLMRPNTAFWICVGCDRAIPLQETIIVGGVGQL